MALWHFVKSNLLWSQGHLILFVLLCMALIGLRWWRPFLYTSALLFCVSVYFFRNPDRVCPELLSDHELMVSPSDGMVVGIRYQKPDQLLEGYAQCVSIYLSFFDVHVTRSPLASIVESITYTPGQFVPAFLVKSSLLNEHNDLVFKNQQDAQVMVRQIAGVIARRICCWVKPGELVPAGLPIGMIRFGSRVDLFLPASVDILVGVGQRVYGGQTPIARWRQEK